jgi:hypothetical protein
MSLKMAGKSRAVRSWCPPRALVSRVFLFTLEDGDVGKSVRVPKRFLGCPSGNWLIEVWVKGSGRKRQPASGRRSQAVSGDRVRDLAPAFPAVEESRSERSSAFKVKGKRFVRRYQDGDSLVARIDPGRWQRPRSARSCWSSCRAPASSAITHHIRSSSWSASLRRINRLLFASASP